jgi:hypothetical protein
LMRLMGDAASSAASHGKFETLIASAIGELYHCLVQVVASDIFERFANHARERTAEGPSAFPSVHFHIASIPAGGEATFS